MDEIYNALKPTLDIIFSMDKLTLVVIAAIILFMLAIFVKAYCLLRSLIRKLVMPKKHFPSNEEIKIGEKEDSMKVTKEDFHHDTVIKESEVAMEKSRIQYVKGKSSDT